MSECTIGRCYSAARVDGGLLTAALRSQNRSEVSRFDISFRVLRVLISSADCTGPGHQAVRPGPELRDLNTESRAPLPTPLPRVPIHAAKKFKDFREFAPEC